MKVKGGFAAAVLALVLMAILFPLGGEVVRHAFAESLYIRKIVSVVYDDSTSMIGDKENYANYAMQAFCGMLNSEDRLFITYMNDDLTAPGYEPQEVDLSAGGIQGSVDAIRNHDSVGQTPFASVEVAFEKLKSVEEANENTQFWLVIITDGEFQDRNESFDDTFRRYVATEMKNGSRPQITFLGIGDVSMPSADEENGIYTYSADSAADITDAMFSMADRISGRTRLAEGSIEQTAADTIRVSSTIPLLNIVLFTQGTEGKVLQAQTENGNDIALVRSVLLGVDRYADLTGGGFLLGDSQNVLGAGSYTIRFDRAIDVENIAVLFEPALEMRMTVMLNGRELSDLGELQEAAAGDRLSLSCAIYEIGTDRRIDPSLLPPDTGFEISLYEDGRLAAQTTDADMLLSEYELHEVQTELVAAVTIPGFNPIRYTVSFVPEERPVYTVSAVGGGSGQSVHIDDIAGSHGVSVRFQVSLDGVPVTDPELVKSLYPNVTASPDGNGGTISYEQDGTIVFTPNTAAVPDGAEDRFTVTVSCCVGSASASQTYAVVLPVYEVVPVGETASIVKTQFYGNQTGVSFYITRDGERMDGTAVQEGIAISLDERHRDLKFRSEVSADGIVSVTPYSEEQHPLTFGTWWGNWAYYWGLNGDDICVTLTHPYGTAQASIQVSEEDILYQLLWVYLPFFVELAILAFLLTWLYLIITKPRFVKGAALYVGNIERNSDGSYNLTNFGGYSLFKRNKFFKNGRWKLKKTADPVNVAGIKIQALRDGYVKILNDSVPWFWGKFLLRNEFFESFTPENIEERLSENATLNISKSIVQNSADEPNRQFGSDEGYTVIPEDSESFHVVEGPCGSIKYPTKGIVFLYTIEKQP